MMIQCSVSGLIFMSTIMMFYYTVIVQAATTGRRKRVPDATQPAANACGSGKFFCEEDPNYPTDIIKSILQKDKGKHEDMFGVESPVPKEMPNTIMSRMGEAENELCPSSSEIIYPKVGEDKNGNKQFIINLDEEYKQGIRVEICRKGGDKCSLSDSFPSGYTTKCVQKYVYRRLLALKDDSSTVVDEFRFPSCCSCSVSGPF